MVVRPREISSSIRDKMMLFDCPVTADRPKRKHSDGSTPPSTLMQTKSPMVQRRGAAGRFSRRSSGRTNREEEESRVPLRRISPSNTAASRGTSRSNRHPLPSDENIPKLHQEDRAGSNSLSDGDGDDDDDCVTLRSAVSTPATDDPTDSRGTLTPGTPGGERTSFLDNKSKVTGIRDVITRMEASNTEPATTDGEARSLLNKFLGAQVMMTGMESMMAAQSGAVREAQSVGAIAAGRSAITGGRPQRSQFRTSRDEEAQWKGSVSATTAASKSSSSEEKLVACGVTISEISDQDKLHEMLEQCDNFDERRKIRARLMTLMQEARARREQASRRRLQHQQQRDGGCVSVNEAQMINDWLSDNFDSDGKETVSETKTSASSSATSKTATSKSVTNTPRSALNKGKAPVSAFDKFKQLDSANPKAMPRTDSNNSDSGGVFKLDPGLAAKAQGAKEMTLYWVQSRVRDYQNVNVSNFSTSWNDGMAFCALIHHFYPDAFDFNKLNPKNRRYNFDLAFKMAEEKAGIYPLLDTDDMVAMKKPDWKCVFTYVQAIYRRLKDGP